MAIIQISKIQHRRGDYSDLPQLSVAEFGYATDNNRLFIGKVFPITPAPGVLYNNEVLTEESVDGSTIIFNSVTGKISAVGGGGGGGVGAVVGGTGISVTNSTGPTATVSLSNSGVSAGAYTTANITVDATGRVTAASDGQLTRIEAPGPTYMEVEEGFAYIYAMTGSDGAEWKYDYDGVITFPNLTLVDDFGGVFTISSTTGVDINFDNSKGRFVLDDGHAYLKAGTSGSSAEWTFDSSGNITFPDGTTQTTAYVGTSGISSIVSGTGILITDGTGPTSTVSLSNSGVAAGSYNNANITVDATGRITVASSGTNLPLVSTSTSTIASNIAVGKCYSTSADITLDTGIFAAGDIFSIYNNSSSNISVVAGAGFTLRLAASTTTGTRTLPGYGIASILFITSSEAVISGTGVS